MNSIAEPGTRVRHTTTGRTGTVVELRRYGRGHRAYETLTVDLDLDGPTVCRHCGSRVTWARGNWSPDAWEEA